jgi:hypothetical protein
VKFETYEKKCRKELDKGNAVLCPICKGYWINNYFSIFSHWDLHLKKGDENE